MHCTHCCTWTIEEQIGYLTAELKHQVPLSIKDPTLPHPDSPAQQFEILARQMSRVLDKAATKNRPPLVAASVSGGADSCFLLRALVAAQEHRELDLHILHVDHGLRSSSQDDAIFVHDLAASLKLPFHSHRLTEAERNTSSRSNLQSALRRGRYRWLSTQALALAGPDRIPILATGHHAGDQVETLLLNLLRGTHLYGLRGIQVWQTLSAPLFDLEPADQDSKVHLFRPLLEWDRPSVEAQLQELGQAWREDPSNQNLGFTRNRIRHQLVPALQELNSQFVPNLARQSLEWAAGIEAVLSLHGAALAELDPRLPASQIPLRSTVLVNQARFQELPAWQQKGTLHAALRHVQPDGQGISTQRLDSLNTALCKREKTGGPWRWFGQIAWSVWEKRPQSEMGLQPVRRIVSLHRLGANPFPLDLPLLVAADWTTTLESDRQHEFCSLPATDPTHRWVLQLSALQEDEPIEMPKQPVRTWTLMVPLEMWHRAGRLTLAAPLPHSRMQPIGMRGRSKSLRDILRDRKIHPSLQGLWPTLYAESGMPIWLCGLHLDQRFALQPQTRNAMYLVWKKEPAMMQNQSHAYP